MSRKDKDDETKDDESKLELEDSREEMEALNVDDLDIEELERRIELSSAWPVDIDGYLCGADCGALCGVLGNPCVLVNTCGVLVDGCQANGGAEP